jgi:hypothetical protein
LAGTGDDEADESGLAGTGDDDADESGLAGTGADDADESGLAGTGADDADASGFAGTGAAMGLLGATTAGVGISIVIDSSTITGGVWGSVANGACGPA